MKAALWALLLSGVPASSRVGESYATFLKRVGPAHEIQKTSHAGEFTAFHKKGDINIVVSVYENVCEFETYSEVSFEEAREIVRNQRPPPKHYEEVSSDEEVVVWKVFGLGLEATYFRKDKTLRIVSASYLARRARDVEAAAIERVKGL